MNGWMSNMKIIASLVTYNESLFVDYVLQSIYDNVDEIIITDSAMENVVKNGGTPNSNDGTLEIIEKWNKKGNKIIISKPKAPPKLFVDLWKDALQIAKDMRGDWLFTACGDEVWPQNTIKPLRPFLNSCDRNGIMGVNVTMNYFAPDFWHYKDFYGPRLAKITDDMTLPFIDGEVHYWPSRGVWQSIELDKVPEHVKKANIDYPKFLRPFHYSCVGYERVKFKYDFYRTFEHNKGSETSTEYLNKNWKYFEERYKIFTGKHPDIMLGHPLYKEKLY